MAGCVGGEAQKLRLTFHTLVVVGHLGIACLHQPPLNSSSHSSPSHEHMLMTSKRSTYFVFLCSHANVSQCISSLSSFTPTWEQRNWRQRRETQENTCFKRGNYLISKESSITPSVGSNVTH